MEYSSCTNAERMDEEGNSFDSISYWCATEIDADRQMLKSGVCKDTCSGGNKEPYRYDIFTIYNIIIIQ